MKIAIIQPRISYYNGGGETIPLEAITHLSHILDDVSFDLYTTKPPLPFTEKYLSFKSKIDPNKVNVFEIEPPLKFKHIYSTPPGSDRPRWDIESLYFNNLVLPLITNNRPDIVWSYYLLDYLLKVKDVPSVLYLLGYPRTNSEYREAMISQYDAVIPITRNVLNKWNDRLSIKIDTTEVLHQGINIGNPTKNLEYFDPDNFNIVFAGRIIERKGLITLLESIKMLRPTINNVKLYIFGEGPFSDEVDKYISGNNLTDNVVLGGYKSDIFSYLCGANLCVFPSHEGEGLMTVVLESMFYNGLVITTHDNGNEEAIIDNINGFLVDPKNPSELANKILYIYKNYSKLSDIKANAKSTIKNKFTWNNHAKRFYRLSAELIKS